MSRWYYRSAPNWGKTNPLPELEVAIAAYAQARQTWKIDDLNWKPSVKQTAARVGFVKKAKRLLGVSGWNATIDALDHYRDNWRGEVVRKTLLRRVA